MSTLSRPAHAIARPGPFRLAAVSTHSLIWAQVALFAVTAFAVRAAGLRRANELFVDELTYTAVAQSVSNGHLPSLGGQPFLLHPPGSFVLNGAVLALFGLTGDRMDLVYDLRWVTAVLGAVMVVLTFLIIRRLTTTSIALVAGVVLTFDPFLLRNDTRVMIETPATVAVLGGLLVLVTALHRGPHLTTRAAVGAGLLFGLGLLTKDVTLFLTILPIALATVWRRTLRPRDAALVCAVAVAPYLGYLAVLAPNHEIGPWWNDAVSGVSRLFGAVQITGFNAPGAPSLIDQLITEVTRYGTSYLLIALGAVAGAAAAALGGTPGRRLLGLTALCTGLLGLYATAFGTLEEQYGYYVAVTSVIALTVTAAEILERRPVARTWVAAPALALAILTVILGVQARVTTDDGYLQARAWLQTHTAANARVALTGPTAKFAFLPQQQTYGVWTSLTSLLDNNAQYVLTQSRPLSQGYGYAAPGLLTWLQDHAQPAFTATGPSGGDTTVWHLDQATVKAAVAAGTDFRPVSGPLH
jgi:4-amino-4-deoxy-L-arabinose transferase-like glycosyltransferase